MLIQKDAKPAPVVKPTVKQFESFVNSERCKTRWVLHLIISAFESFVNSERCKTSTQQEYNPIGLRALLIQKDAKRLSNTTRCCTV